MDMSLKSRFEKHIEKYVDKNDALVVAVSGGVDSSVMLSLLVDLGFKNLVVAHLDHGLRKESGDDYKFVEELANKYGLEFRGTKITVDKSSNVEANARKVRYEFLEDVRNEFDAKYILTAHHKNDQAETVFMNLSRGSFIKGMAGMNTVCEKKKVFRPLLPFTKVEIEEYATQNNVGFIIDASNSEIDFDRNFLRNEIFPVVESRFPAAQERIADTACFYRELVDFFDVEVKKWIWDKCEKFGYGIKVHKDEFEKLQNFFKFFVLSELVGFKFSQADFLEVLKLVDEAVSGSMRQVGEMFIYVTSDHFLVTEFSVEALSGFYFGEMLKTLELGKHRSIRTFRDGDIYEGKKLKKYFLEKNVPWYLRSGVAVVVDESDQITDVIH